MDPRASTNSRLLLRTQRALPSRLARAACLIVPLALSQACNQQQPPVAAPSGDQPSYAERYPSKLETVRTRFDESEKEARDALPEFKTLPDSVKNADYAAVKEVVERADEEGKSAAYAEGALEEETVERFLDEEKEPLRQKVAGGVNYAAKQKDCSEDLGGAAVASMERGIEKQLEERRHDRSEAHRYIEDHQDELGKANVETLEKHADRIARTSHIVNVRLELYRRELATLLEDAGSAESTLDRVIRESDAVIADANSSKSKKAAAEKRKADAQKARARIEADVAEARKASEGLEQRISTAKRDYDTAFDALVDDLESRTKK